MQEYKKAASAAQSLYSPQTLSVSRIVLPHRFAAAGMLFILLVASAIGFVVDQLQTHDASYVRPPSPIATAEAAPLLPPAKDTRIDEAAATMPKAALAELPLREVAQPKIHTVDISVQSKLQPLPAAVSAAAGRIEQLTAQGIAAGRAGDYPAADKALRAALALDRGNPVILYNLALVAEHRRDPDSARTLYDAALRQAAERPDTAIDPDLVIRRLQALDDKLVAVDKDQG